MKLKIIAHIYTDFPEKFGIPRQSGFVKELKGRIVFEPEYRSMDAVRGLDGYDYIWLLWEFQGVEKEHWSATVKPPRLGGNTSMGVFATRSPFRPNPIGLSSVRLEHIESTDKGPVLHVSGADLRDGTPIYDIKPYLPGTDSHPEARGGFAAEVEDYTLQVEFPDYLLEKFPQDKRQGILGVLQQDPRPAYHDDPGRNYGVSFAGKDVHFYVKDGILTVYEVVDITQNEQDYKVNL